MANTISHEGIIEFLKGTSVYVRIVQSSACAGCKIASHCATSESKIKQVEVTVADPSRYNVGDKVTVHASESAGFTAVLYGFIIPFIVMTGTIFGTYWWLGSEQEHIAALIGLATLVPYYAILYLCKGYFKRKITFYIA